ncbi:MAG TPA: hypothetical protein DCR55_01370 [Lentisphaeria bacterium]|jgi:CRP-like cAMP-binding protein|nr:hypothetical protein [Lentisphaeria bacterium]
MEASLDISNLPSRSFSAGEIILEQGARKSQAYILQSGTLSVSVSGNVVCKVDTEGAVIGEISALLGCEVSATVTAKTNATVYVIEDFNNFLGADSAAALNVAQILAGRVVNMNGHFAQIRDEVDALQSSSGSSRSRLRQMLYDLEEFWATEVLVIRPRRK